LFLDLIQKELGKATGLENGVGVSEVQQENETMTVGT